MLKFEMYKNNVKATLWVKYNNMISWQTQVLKYFLKTWLLA